MNKKNIIVFVVVLAVTAGTASICKHLSKSRLLGPAGLKLVAKDVYDEKGNVIGTNTVDLPQNVLNYESSTNLAITTIELQTLPSDTTFGRRIYFAPDKFGLLLSVVMMGTDSRSIHRPEHCLPGQGWKIEKSETVNIQVKQPIAYELPVKKITASREIEDENGKKQKLHGLYVYWFVAENDLASEHLDRMWKMGKSMVTTGVLQRWSYVATLAHCAPGQEDPTFARMKEFIAASVPQFQITTGKMAAGKPVSGETALAEAQK